MSDCGCDAIKSQLTPFSEALETILKQAKTVTGSETLKLEEASGRILGAALQSAGFPTHTGRRHGAAPASRQRRPHLHRSAGSTGSRCRGDAGAYDCT